MERKAWSWKKKKVLEKLASSRPKNSDSSQALEDYPKQSLGDVIRTQSAFKDQLNTVDGMSEADGMSEVDIKLRILSEQLLARDELAQQHAKVAEEAVTGWEKAECEAACLKQQLNEELLYKAATAEQMAELQNALKDNVGKLQNAEKREQQLQKLMEMKTGELNSLRSQLDSTMSKIVHEMTRAAKEADARSRAEDRAGILQKRVDVVEKEQAELKYELNVLAKELDIRSEELKLSKQAAENANKQHLENVRRAAKLEEDCQRLWLLLHKRNPDPAVITQMKIEAEAPCPIILDRASCSKAASSRFNEVYVESALSVASQELESRLAAIEEENRTLKDALAKKDGELQSSRLLCAKTASKLSVAQEQLEKAMHLHPRPAFHRSTKSAMDGYSMSLLEQPLAPLDHPDEGDCAESWASALIKELAQIRKDKVAAPAHAIFGLSSADLMDDFVEMEKLASLPVENQEEILGEVLGKGNELRSKLTSIENELISVKVENVATKAALTSIEKHLITILQAEMEERASNIDIFEEVRAALDSMYKHLTDSIGPSFALCHGMDSPEVRDTTTWSPVDQWSCQSEDASICKQEAKSSDPKKIHIGQKLCSAVRRVVSLFEELTQAEWKEDISSDAGDMPTRTHAEKLWKTSEFECCIRSLILLCNGALEDRVDVNDFLEEMASALEWLVNHVYVSSSENLPNARKQLEFGGHANCRPLLLLEEAFVRDECIHNHDSMSIEKQLKQLKREKEIIDMKLGAMTRELELSKPALQNAEESNSPEVNGSSLAARDGDENVVGSKTMQDVKLRKLHSYQPNVMTGTSKGIQTHGYRNVAHPIRMHLPSFQWQQTPLTMVSGNDCSSRPVEEAGKKPDEEQEAGSHAEKLSECQQTTMFLGQQLQTLGKPGHVGEALLKSEHSYVTAQRRAQRSLDQLDTIREDSSLYDEKRIDNVPCGNNLSYAKVSLDLQKDCPHKPERDLASGKSPARFIRSKNEMKVDSSPERHNAKGLSRFFSKSKPLTEART